MIADQPAPCPGNRHTGRITPHTSQNIGTADRLRTAPPAFLPAPPAVSAALLIDPFPKGRLRSSRRGGHKQRKRRDLQRHRRERRLRPSRRHVGKSVRPTPSRPVDAPFPHTSHRRPTGDHDRTRKAQARGTVTHATASRPTRGKSSGPLCSKDDRQSLGALCGVTHQEAFC